eukprot:1620845-Amphidinium_carterae.1
MDVRAVCETAILLFWAPGLAAMPLLAFAVLSSWVLQVATVQLDECVDRTSLLPPALTCPTVAEVGVCHILGAVCPVSCGLCDVVHGPPSCTQQDVFVHKSRLATFLQDLGVCPMCRAPPVEAFTHNDTIFVEKPPNEFASAVTYGYSSPDLLDPCAQPLVYCSRCGEAISLYWNTDIVDPPGNLTASLFDLTSLQ